MKNSLRKINVAFLLVTLIPVCFAIYELNLLSKNERVVREAYQNQLDAILYSVNQYSDDLISSWASRARLKIKEGSDTAADFQSSWQTLVNQSDVIKAVYFSDGQSKSVLYNTSDSSGQPANIQVALDQLIQRETEKISRLIEYEQAGFRKMEAINIQVAPDCIPVIFALGENNSHYTVGALVLNLPSFITHSLSPKLQAISREEFIISAYNKVNDSLVYSTQPTDSINAANDLGVFKGQMQEKDFWILPGYYLGITLKTATLDDLVQDRTVTSIVVISLMGLLLVAGLFFLYRNIRHEMRLSQAKSEFVSNVSHEIRTPLSLIGMFAETLEAGRAQTEEKKQEYYTIISKETSRLSKIVNRILDFSQLESNKKIFRFVPLSLNAMCVEILETYFYHWREKGFEFQFVPDNQLPEIYGDREAVSEAVINLLDNAVKYSHYDKHITVKTLSDHQYAHVEVVDRGIGIARQYHTEVFEQFFRAPIGNIHNSKGSGLGLTLVKKIMEAHHGKVTVESAPGKGSTFRLSFSLKKPVE
jgi:two-component system phosphate regulon sensor histidine kinase PhoR